MIEVQSLNKSGWTFVKGEEKITVRVNQYPLSDTFDYIGQDFNGNWRRGQEIKQVVVTKRLYQVSANNSQAWFSNWSNLLNEIFNEIRLYYYLL